MADDSEKTPQIRLNRSLKVNIEGKERVFPTLEDYVEQLIETDYIEAQEGIFQDSDLVQEIFFSWVKHGQTSCRFARTLAHDPATARWVPIVELDALNRDELAKFVNERLDQASGDNEAVQLIFPDLETIDDIVRLTNTLCVNDRWYWTESEMEDPPESTFLLGLRWILPCGRCVNPVIGFAPARTMPLTRRAPFLSLGIRVSNVLRAPEPRKIERNMVQVHLADMDSGLPKERHDNVWTQTQVEKAKFIKPEMRGAAKARVTFCLPQEYRNAMCEPTVVRTEKLSLVNAIEFVNQTSEGK